MNYLRPRQVADMIGVSTYQIYSAILDGSLPALKRKGYKGRKGTIIIRAEDADAWVKKTFEEVAK